MTFRILFGYYDWVPAYLDIPKDTLRELYLVKRLSSRKIAKLFNCAYSTIDIKIRLAKFPIRNLAEAHIIYPRKNFDGDLTEKAYLVGFRIGDLRVRKVYKNSKTINVDCGSTKPEQIELIKQLFSPYGRVWIGKPNYKGAQQIECFLNDSFSFLLSKDPEEWMFSNRQHFIGFLAGFTDAEGTIFITKKGLSCFAIGNYDISLLTKIKSKLEIFGITPHKITCSKRQGLIASHGYRYNHDYWTLSISRKADMLKLLSLIGPYLKHAKRITQMKAAIKNIEERNKLYGQK